MTGGDSFGPLHGSAKQHVCTTTPIGWLWYCDAHQTHGNASSQDEAEVYAEAHYEYFAKERDVAPCDVIVWFRAPHELQLTGRAAQQRLKGAASEASEQLEEPLASEAGHRGTSTSGPRLTVGADVLRDATASSPVFRRCLRLWTWSGRLSIAAGISLWGQPRSLRPGRTPTAPPGRGTSPMSLAFALSAPAAPVPLGVTLTTNLLGHVTPGPTVPAALRLRSSGRPEAKRTHQSILDTWA